MLLVAGGEGLKQILLAEDNPADVYLIREALNLQAFEFHLNVVSDGEEALQYVERKGKYQGAPDPDLIILDLNLPKSDGSDVLRRIRERSDMNRIPVVILTSSDSPRDRSIVAKLGADSYLTKPSDLDAFLALGETFVRFVNPVRDQGRGCTN
ncbi:MAG TPA: response regulator [Bryobacteraceae bacterium]|nr:response regulator [Bryobacteraceae bacterium]